jgi:hypothetical protein
MIIGGRTFQIELPSRTVDGAVWVRMLGKVSMLRLRSR